MPASAARVSLESVWSKDPGAGKCSVVGLVGRGAAVAWRFCCLWSCPFSGAKILSAAVIPDKAMS